MNAGTKLSALNKFRGSNSVMMKQQQPATKVLVVYDVQVKAPDVFQVPLVINYGESPSIPYIPNNAIICFSVTDLPKAVEEYAHRFVVFLLSTSPNIDTLYKLSALRLQFPLISLELVLS